MRTQISASPRFALSESLLCADFPPRRRAPCGKSSSATKTTSVERPTSERYRRPAGACKRDAQRESHPLYPSDSAPRSASARPRRLLGPQSAERDALARVRWRRLSMHMIMQHAPAMSNGANRRLLRQDKATACAAAPRDALLSSCTCRLEGPAPDAGLPPDPPMPASLLRELSKCRLVFRRSWAKLGSGLALV